MKDDILIEAIIKIANHPKVLKLCEPQVCFPFKLETWMVVRTLKALELYQEAYNVNSSIS